MGKRVKYIEKAYFFTHKGIKEQSVNCQSLNCAASFIIGKAMNKKITHADNVCSSVAQPKGYHSKRAVDSLMNHLFNLNTF